MSKYQLNQDLAITHKIEENVQEAAQHTLDSLTASDRDSSGVVKLSTGKDYYKEALEKQKVDLEMVKRVHKATTTILQGEALAVASVAPGIFADDKEVTAVRLDSRGDLVDNTSVVKRTAEVRNPTNGEKTEVMGQLQTSSKLRVSAAAVEKIKAFSKESTRTALAD